MLNGWLWVYPAPEWYFLDAWCLALFIQYIIYILYGVDVKNLFLGGIYSTLLDTVEILINFNLHLLCDRFAIIRDMTAAGLGLNKFCYAGLITAFKNKLPTTEETPKKVCPAPHHQSFLILQIYIYVYVTSL